MPPKDEIYWKIVNAAISLEIQQGHLKWTMTRLASLSGVKRPLIYYYLGKSKLEIVKEAIHLLGSELSGETPDRIEQWKRGDLIKGFLSTRNLFEQTPALLPFYFLNRNKNNEIGSAIRSKEKAFKRKIAKFFPHLNTDQIDGFFALFFGISFAPGISKNAVQKALSQISFKN